jgi:hypothetical protein
LEIECPLQIERAAQRYVSRLVMQATDTQADKQPEAPETASQTANKQMPQPLIEVDNTADFQEVDVNSLQMTQPRPVGVEHLGLCALTQLGVIEKLAEPGINGVGRAAIIGNRPTNAIGNFHLELAATRAGRECPICRCIAPRTL